VKRNTYSRHLSPPTLPPDFGLSIEMRLPFTLRPHARVFMSQRDSGPQVAEPVASLMEIDGGGEGAEAGVSRSAAAAAEALPSPSQRTRVAAPAAPQAQGQGQEQATADRALATTTTTMRGRSRAAVVSSRELMERVLGFVAGGSREAREEVGRAAAVCRVWREAAYGEEVWGGMASLVLPVVGAGGWGWGARVEGTWRGWGDAWRSGVCVMWTIGGRGCVCTLRCGTVVTGCECCRSRAGSVSM
jgi:hypothetical protein